MSATHRLLRFGVFELNLDTEEVRKEGVTLKLAPHPFKVLAILAGRSGEIVPREDIRQSLWGEETYVDFEHGLNQCIKQIRTVLNDNSSRPLYIETLPRKGYRFLAPVTSKTIEVMPKVTASSSGVQPKVVLPLQKAQTPLAMDSAGLAAAPAAGHGSPATALPDVVPMEEAAAAEKAAPEPTKPRAQKRFVAGAMLAALAVIAVAFYWHSQKANALMEKDTVVLADFANSTGEPVFDDTLKQALRIQLEQSPFLNLVADQKVNATLKLMGRTGGERLTSDVARDLCQRIGSKAMLTGSIAQLGTQYVIGLQAVNCSSGEMLAEALEQARSKEDVLKALDRASVQVRRRLGESLKTIQNFATPVEEATTPSLDALKAYSLGAKISREKGGEASRSYFEQAIQLDPNFALAYTQLALSYINEGQPERAKPYFTKAFELREHASERERLVISALYYHVVTGELDKAAQIYQQLADYYPRYYAAYWNLSLLYSSLGHYDKAIEMARQANLLSPERVGLYDNLINFSVASQQFEEAGKLIRQAEQRKLDSYQTHVAQYILAFLASNSSLMEEQLHWLASNMSLENLGWSLAADTEAYAGHSSKSQELSKKAVESAVRTDNAETGATWYARLATREAAFGNYAAAQQAAAAGLKLDSKSAVVRAEAALSYAMAGSSEAAELIVRDLNANYPLDTHVQSLFLPAIQGQLALNRKNPAEAISQLQRALPPIEYALEDTCLYPTYVRGQAYLASGQGAAASAEFKKVIDHSGIVGNCWTGALANLGMARASTLQSRSLQGADADAAHARALSEYMNFLALWKTADSDIPIYKQAQAEYAKLE